MQCVHAVVCTCTCASVKPHNQNLNQPIGPCPGTTSSIVVMTESARMLPLDVHYASLPDWIMQRQVVEANWLRKLRPVRDKIQAAVSDLVAARCAQDNSGPSSEDKECSLLDSKVYAAVREAVSRCCLATLADPSGMSNVADQVLYCDAKSIFEGLLDGVSKDPSRSAGKNFFGSFSDPLLSAWDSICHDYRRGNMYIAEAARALKIDVQYEIGSMKSSSDRRDRRVVQIGRRIDELSNSIREVERTLQVKCTRSNVSVERGDFRKQLEQRVDEIPPRLRAIHEKVKSDEMLEAANYYAAFTDYVHVSSSDVRPRLKNIKKLASEDLAGVNSKQGKNLSDSTDENSKREGTPASIDWSSGIESGITEQSAGDNEAAEIDWSAALESGLDADGGETNGVAVEIDWNANNGEEIDWTAQFSTTTSSAGGSPEEDNRPLSSPEERHELLTDLFELDCFLVQRIREIENSTGTGGVTSLHDYPGSLRSHGARSLEKWLDLVRKICDMMNDKSLQELLVISRGGHGFDRIVLEFDREIEKKSKILRQIDSLSTERIKLVDENKRKRPILEYYRAKVKRVKAIAEQGLSEHFKGRQINLVGDLNTI